MIIFTPKNQSDIYGSIHWIRENYLSEINRYVLATSSSTYSSEYKWGGPGALNDYSLKPGTSYSCWCSNNIPHSNFSIHFLQHQLFITHYTIHGRVTDFDLISSWILDGSNNNISWTNIDKKVDDKNLSQSVDNPGKYRYFRFTHIGKTSVYSKDHFGLCKIDLFGRLYDENIVNTIYISIDLSFFIIYLSNIIIIF